MEWGNIPEWIQGIGTLIAAYLAFKAIKYTQKEMINRTNEQQKEINEVIALTRQIEQQNRNFIQSEKKKDERRKNDIKPLFTLFPIQPANYKYIGFKLRNDGQTATITSFNLLNPQKWPINFNMIYGDSPRMLKNQVIEFSLTPKEIGKINLNEHSFTGLIHFYDLDGNVYTLYINFNKLDISLGQIEEIPELKNSY